jgi:hypothetical protein
MGCEVDGTGSGSCPGVGFSISGVEPWGCGTKHSVQLRNTETSKRRANKRCTDMSCRHTVYQYQLITELSHIAKPWTQDGQFLSNPDKNRPAVRGWLHVGSPDSRFSLFSSVPPSIRHDHCLTRPLCLA